MTTQTTSDDEQMMYTNSGGPVPVFSGAMEDYASWRADVMDWEHSVKLPGHVKGSRLVLVQTDIIKKTMRSIGEQKVRSAEGFKLIMATMDALMQVKEQEITGYVQELQQKEAGCHDR